MSGPLPVNAKLYANNNYDSNPRIDDSVLTSSFDRQESIARLGSSPVPSFKLGTSPARSTYSHRRYGSTQTGNNDSFLRPPSVYNENSGDLPDQEVMKVVKRHLVSGSYTSQNNLGTSPGSRYSASNDGSDNNDIGSVHHHLPGGSVTHDIYKWTDSVEQERRARNKRSKSFMVPRNEPSDPALMNLRDPGGFRRHYIIDKAAKVGKKPPFWITRTFVDFLALYGHFGGEDLSDYEDDMDSDIEDGGRKKWSGEDDELDEGTSLLDHTDEPVEGTATPAKAVFLLLKSFIGTGVMFLPKAFHNGGLLFSTVFLAFIASISLYSFLLLVQTRNKVPASFGDIGGILFGSKMRMLVLIAITTSQIGFVCAYMVFVAQSLQSLVLSVTNCEKNISLYYLIFVQIGLFVPLAMIRKIQKLSVFALIADAFILLGLSYLYYYDIWTLTVKGVGQIEWFINPSSFPMFIGTAVFTFEGVGLIIPITESMKEPKKFPKVLSWTMLFITLLFVSIGFLSYMAFGNEVQTVILLNLPATHLVNSIQGLYALAICLSIPLQLFPAIRIVETGLFSRSGKYNSIVKWQKNLFRLLAVIVCAFVAAAGSSDLDKFVSIIGSVFCIPLCFLFPPLFHLKAIASNWKQKSVDIAIITFGMVSMIYTTYITISLWTGESEPISPIGCIPHA
ncbi:transmembrane amino acid transporter protein-domain-containing protein [Pilobolus umbonatus]|nr:transmembrane amino acid transporter protein-domain-containing protein [Pilobolus umbonatus]